MSKSDLAIVAMSIIAVFVCMFGIMIAEISRLENEINNVYNRVTEIEKEIYPK